MKPFSFGKSTNNLNSLQIDDLVVTNNITQGVLQYADDYQYNSSSINNTLVLRDANANINVDDITCNSIYPLTTNTYLLGNASKRFNIGYFNGINALSYIYLYDSTNDGNPEINLGGSSIERLKIESIFDIGTTNLDYINFKSSCASVTNNKGQMKFLVDDINICNIYDNGLNLETGKSLYINDDEIINSTTLGNNIISSSLQSLGTISSGVWTGTAINDTYISSATIWNNKQNALTFGISDTNSIVIDNVSVANNDYARFTLNGLEGRNYNEVKTDLSLNNVENTTLSTWTGSTNISTIGSLSTNILPAITNTYDIGSSLYRFDNIYCQNIDNDGGVTIFDSAVSNTPLILRSNADVSGFDFVIDNTSVLKCQDSGSGDVWSTKAGKILVTNQIDASIDNTYSCGSASFRFSDIYAASGSVNTSDINLKKDIKPLEFGLDFINKLKPVNYKFKNGNRYHFGLIAQDIETLKYKSFNSKNYGVFINGEFAKQKELNNAIKSHDLKQKNIELYNKKHKKPYKKVEFDKNEFYKGANKHLKGLRYSEFIAPLIKSIQELTKIVNNQQKQIDKLLSIDDNDTIISDIDEDHENELKEQLLEIQKKNELKKQKIKNRIKLSFE